MNPMSGDVWVVLDRTGMLVPCNLFISGLQRLVIREWESELWPLSSVRQRVLAPNLDRELVGILASMGVLAWSWVSTRSLPGVILTCFGNSPCSCSWNFFPYCCSRHCFRTTFASTGCKVRWEVVVSGQIFLQTAHASTAGLLKPSLYDEHTGPVSALYARAERLEAISSSNLKRYGEAQGQLSMSATSDPIHLIHSNSIYIQGMFGNCAKKSLNPTPLSRFQLLDENPGSGKSFTSSIPPIASLRKKMSVAVTLCK